MFSLFSHLIQAFKTAFRRPPYWVEITTDRPHCLYYFGDFDSYSEAEQMQNGYVEDLLAEQAEGIEVAIKRCSPTNLTVTEEEFLAG